MKVLSPSDINRIILGHAERIIRHSLKAAHSAAVARVDIEAAENFEAADLVYSAQRSAQEAARTADSIIQLLPRKDGAQ